MSSLRELVDAAVSRRVRAWAKMIKLTPSDARFPQFRQDVTEALHACVGLHIAEQEPYFKMLTRPADMRRRLKEEAREARDLAQRLRDKQEAKKGRDLAQRLRDFGSKYRHPTMVLSPGRALDLAAPDPQDLDALALLLEDAAAACKDTGGPTRKMAAFDVLAEGLVRAYQCATKRKGTGGNVRGEDRSSQVRKLVEDVLWTADELLTGKPLKAPATAFLGDRLDEIAKRLLKRQQRLDEIAKQLLRRAQPPKTANNSLQNGVIPPGQKNSQ